MNGDVAALSHTSPAARSRLIYGLLVGLLYFAAGKFGLSLALIHNSASSIWPPTGIALAALIVLGRELWPAILVAAFLVNVTTAENVLSSAGIAVGNALEAVIGAHLAEQFARGRHAFDRPGSVVTYAVVAGILATGVSATIGVANLAMAGGATPPDVVQVWLTWWLGDMGGALIVAPLLILWASRTDFIFSPVRLIEIAALFLTQIVVGQVLFGGILPVRGLPVQFFVVPFLVWAALRFGPRETATAIFILAVLAVMGTLRGHGPFAGLNQNDSLLVLQGFMVVIATTVLVLAAAVEEQRRIQQALRRAHDQLDQRVQERTQELAEANAALRSEVDERTQTEARLRRSEGQLRRSDEQLRLAQHIAGLGSWSWDIRIDQVTWSDELYRIFGLERQQFDGTYHAYLNLIVPEERPRIEALVAEAIQTHEPFEYYQTVVRPDGHRTVYTRGEMVLDPQGSLTGMIGCCLDVTEMKKAEAELQQAHDELERRVTERTGELGRANAELMEKNAELERFSDVVVGRELKMMEMKKELDQLRQQVEREQRS